MTQNKVQTIKVERKEIFLGDIRLEVFRLPDGTYTLSQTQCTEAINLLEASVRRFIVSKQPESLPFNDFTPVKGKVIGEKSTTVNLLPFPLVAAYWGLQAMKGNKEAFLLLIACTAESLERRADVVFEVDKKEDEYNRQFEELRSFGKKSRRSFTDSIQSYIKRNNLEGGFAAWLPKNATDDLNRFLFGKNASKLKLEKGKIVRDGCTLGEIRNLEIIEGLAAKLVDLHNVNPRDAIKKAATMWQIQSE